MDTFELRSLGRVESTLTDLADAPRQAEGAPEAWLAIDEEYAEAVHGTPILDLKPVLDEREG